MKIISVICFILLVIAFASAHGCGSCPPGSFSLTKFGICACIEPVNCHDVNLGSRIVSTWTTNGVCYTQYEITITNNLDINISNIVLGADASLPGRLVGEVWNMRTCGANQYTLPAIQPSINAHQSYTFGFIVSGQGICPFSILSVIF